MRSKLRVVVIFCIAILVVGVAGLYLSNKYSKHLALEWFISYSQGDNEVARQTAMRLGWFDRKRSIYALAQMDMSDSLLLTGELRNEMLSHSLKALERGGPYGDRSYWFLWREAGLASLLGDTVKAKKYLHEACGAENKKNFSDDNACLREAYRTSRESMLSSSRLRDNAMRLYEVVEVARVAGGIDHDELAFDDALIMIAFNKAEAIRMRDELSKEGKMTPQRVEEFDKVVLLSEEPVAPFTAPSSTTM